jgi:hypothetical protein
MGEPSPSVRIALLANVLRRARVLLKRAEGYAERLSALDAWLDEQLDAARPKPVAPPVVAREEFREPTREEAEAAAESIGPGARAAVRSTGRVNSDAMHALELDATCFVGPEVRERLWRDAGRSRFSLATEAQARRFVVALAREIASRGSVTPAPTPPPPEPPPIHSGGFTTDPDEQAPDEGGMDHSLPRGDREDAA